MALRIVPWNFLGRGYPASALVSQATVEVAYPLAGLYDGRTSPVCQWDPTVAILAADVAMPLNAVTEGSFEVDAAGWLVDAEGTYTVDATDPKDGASSLKCISTGNDTYARQHVTVFADHLYEVRVSTRGEAGVPSTARFAVMEMESGVDANGYGRLWLQSDGTFTTTQTWHGTTAVYAWTDTVIRFRTPSFASWGRTTGTVTILLHTSAGGTCYFDEISMAPAVDTVAVIGHNLPSYATIGLYDWPDYTGGNLLGSVAATQPVSFFRLATPAYFPTMSVAATWPATFGPLRAPYIGEIYVGQSVLLRTPKIRMATEWSEDQIRLQARGHVSTYRDHHYPQRSPRIELDFTTSAERVAVRDQWMLATEWGSRPHLVMPATGAQPDVCLFATVEPTYTEEHDHQDLYFHAEYQVKELPILRHEPPVVAAAVEGEGV